MAGFSIHYIYELFCMMYIYCMNCLLLKMFLTNRRYQNGSNTTFLGNVPLSICIGVGNVTNTSDKFWLFLLLLYYEYIAIADYQQISIQENGSNEDQL